MKKHLLIVAGLILCLPVQGQERTTVMNDVTIWYDAFNNRDAALAQKVMSEDWNDIPAAPGQPPGRKGVEFILDDLSKAFPDFRITPVEILQDGNKVVVRSELKIIRTWHSEDWLTALHQLGAFEK
jgi:SnoaL-like domain